METEKELNAKILELTMKIQNDHPEFAVLIDEMPVTIPDENKPEINVAILKDYYDSLQTILNKFT